jgi:alpha-2-macroglobulin
MVERVFRLFNGLIFLPLVLLVFGSMDLAISAGQMEAAKKQYLQGNFKKSFAIFEKIAVENAISKDSPKAFRQAVLCLDKLNRISETDRFREKIISLHSQNWQMLSEAANSYIQTRHHGYIINNDFVRGRHRGRGKYVSSLKRDQVRAIQLFLQAMEVAEKTEESSSDYAVIYFELANLLYSYHGGMAWSFLELSDFSVLPDYNKDSYHDSFPERGAPVDSFDKPIFFTLPETFEEAENDGQRWRWLLWKAEKSNSGFKYRSLTSFADFLRINFGVQTLAGRNHILSIITGDPGNEQRPPSTFRLNRLADDETIARLATGIKRFKLPEKQNFINIYTELKSYSVLAQIFENRCQFEKAAHFRKLAGQKIQFEQITGNWGGFEPTMTHPAGKNVRIDYRFRNGSNVSFEAWPIKVELLLDDLKSLIKENPRELEWQKVNLGQIGYRLVNKNETKYLGDISHEWTRKLEPAAGHFDKRVSIETPLSVSGAYLLKARMENGNTSRIIIWINDFVLIKKMLDNMVMFLVADAVTGNPVKGVNLEFFGYQRFWKNKLSRHQTVISNFAEFSNTHGQVVLSRNKKENPLCTSNQELSPKLRWLVSARGRDNKFGFLGFSNVWYRRLADDSYSQKKIFSITDRPVYRPEQTVSFNSWIRQPRYEQEDGSQYAGQSFLVRIIDPRGNKLLNKNYTTDDFGGVSGSYEIPLNAPLGIYRLQVNNRNAGYFRVEEYKKPEFEVKVDTPDFPSKLGEQIPVTVRADYYFGAPVIHAQVKYKILRYKHRIQRFPAGHWDWLYGPGYWWFSDASWYPDWNRWGCLKPGPWWIPQRNFPPEIIAENEAELDSNGELKLFINTSIAKETQPDIDHRYEVQVEVRDLSRRTVIGKGKIIAGSSPFIVRTWLQKGYYHPGETIQADFLVKTLNNIPVSGTGRVKLYKISYEQSGEIVEKEVNNWAIDFNNNDAGEKRLSFSAASPGQYRLSCVFTGQEGLEQEGALIFNILGEQSKDPADFSFNQLELIPDKKIYEPGEKVNLLINTRQPDSTVFLFLRPVNGVYSFPRIIKMEGKSHLLSLEVEAGDRPNFFLEAITIAAGKLHTEVRQIAVPPDNRMLDLSIIPEKKQYKPGETAVLKLRVSDKNKPFTGTIVCAVYDGALEYISGGSNVPEIKSFFWKWRRRHNPRTESNLDLRFGNLLKANEKTLRNLGVFGHLTAQQPGEISVDKAGIKTKGKSFSKLDPRLGLDQTLEGRMLRKDSPGGAGVEGLESGNVQPIIRTEFADSAFWSQAVEIDDKAIAEIKFKLPDNLTRWKIKAWAMDHGTRVGEADAEIISKKEVMLRLQSPRFFTVGDRCTLSANVHNYLKGTKLSGNKVKVKLKLSGPCLKLDSPGTKEVFINSGDELRVDWQAQVVQDGNAVIRMTAITDQDSDSMEMIIPVQTHGIMKMISKNEVIRNTDKSTSIIFELPEKRMKGSEILRLNYSPSPATAMVDALPYLAFYPYGSTEQTLNRFLPAVITLNALKKTGISLASLKERKGNLNPQEIGDAAKRAKQWQQEGMEVKNPVYDDGQVKEMVKLGVAGLTSMQLGNGGWGWFSGYGERAYPHTTALVVHGLLVASENGVAIVPDVLKKGINWLKRYQKQELEKLDNGLLEPRIKPWKKQVDNLDAFILLVLTDAHEFEKRMGNYLYQQRNKLSVYGKILLALAFENQKEHDKLAMLRENIEQYQVIDPENHTMYLDLGNEQYWWNWYGSDIETHAALLKLLSRVSLKSDKTSMLVKYLINNRSHGNHWNSTRSTAMCIEALAEFLEKSSPDSRHSINDKKNKLVSDIKVKISLNNKVIKESRITSKNLFSVDKGIVLQNSLNTGRQHLVVERTGTGPLYINAWLQYFSLAKQITATGLEIKVNRYCYRVVEKQLTRTNEGNRGQLLKQEVARESRIPLKDGELLASGEVMEVELVVESKNDYEYIIIEDNKAAGFEPVEIRSGYNYNGLRVYQEFRDKKAAFFIRSLPRGKSSIRYKLRAETPGTFSALPAMAYGMYAPELSANSDEIKFEIGH